MKRLKAAFPDFVAGFDLVGQEDKGEPLIAFVDELLQLSEADIRVFYHAGETSESSGTWKATFISSLLSFTHLRRSRKLYKHF